MNWDAITALGTWGGVVVLLGGGLIVLGAMRNSVNNMERLLERVVDKVEDHETRISHVEARQGGD